MLYKWHLLILLTRLYLEPVQTNSILSVLKHCLIIGLPWLMHNDLHWLTVSQRIQYMVSSFLLSSALGSEISQRLLSACVESSQYLVCHTSSTVCSMGLLQHGWKPCFSVARPTVWNSVPDDLWDPAVVGTGKRIYSPDITVLAH